MFFKNLFNKNGDQLAREAIDDYTKGRDEFAVIQKLKKALKLGIENYPLDHIYLHIGSSYFDLSLHDKAKEAYEKAYEINPNNSSVISNLGLSYKNLGEPEKAFQLYFNALRVNPNNSFAHHNIGLYYYEIGDHLQALEFLDKAIKINPGLSVAYAVKARCLAFIGRYKDALKYLKESKIRGYDNADELKKDLDYINKNNPDIFWNQGKFLQLVHLLSNEDKGLISKINTASKDPYMFYKENDNIYYEKHLTSLEIYNILPIIILLDFLSDNNKLVIINKDETPNKVISGIETVLKEEYEIEDNFFNEFRNDFDYYENDDLLEFIASKLKLNLKLELIEFWLSDDQLLVTFMKSEEWENLRYPFSGNFSGYGRIRSIATDETIKNYLTKD